MTHDYSPLGSERDLPGDPCGIRLLARRYADTADEIVAAADRLHRTGTGTDGVWKGLAGKEFPAKARDLSERIRKAETRYRETGTALARFADRAELAQDDAARAAERARDAEATIRATAPGPAPCGPVTPEALAEDRARAEQHRLARSRLATARRDFFDAKQDYDRAAREAHDAIRRAGSKDGLRDSWFYRNWEKISTALTYIALAVLLVTVVCLLLPVVVGTAWAGAALVASAAAFAEVAGAALAVAMLLWNLGGMAAGHDVSATTIALDALGVVTFGITRFLAAPRMAQLAGRTRQVAIVNRGVDTALDSMAKFDTYVHRAPTLLHFLARESLRPLALDDAILRGLRASDELDTALRVAARQADSPALRLLLRADPAELATLARLAAMDPAYAAPFLKGLTYSVGSGTLQNLSDIASVSHSLGELQDSEARRATTEERAEIITESVHRHVLSAP